LFLLVVILGNDERDHEAKFFHCSNTQTNKESDAVDLRPLLSSYDGGFHDSQVFHPIQY